MDYENFFVCSDEVYFYLTLLLNKQNNRIWADSQPLVGIEMPLHEEKVLCDFGRKDLWALLLFRVRKPAQLLDHA
jgi:hypothetical protein